MERQRHFGFYLTTGLENFHPSHRVDISFRYSFLYCTYVLLFRLYISPVLICLLVFCFCFLLGKNHSNSRPALLPEPVGKGLLQNSSVQPIQLEIDRTRPSSYLGNNAYVAVGSISSSII